MDRVQAEPTASMRLLWPFALVSRARMVHPSLIFEQSGVEPAIRDPEARVAHSVLARLLDAAVEHTGLPELGLIAAEQLRPGDLDLFELVVRSQPTLGACFDCMARLSPLMHEGVAIEVSRRALDFEVSLRFIEPLRVHPAAYDFVLAVMLIAARRAVGRDDLHATEVLMPYPARPELDPYRRAFGCVPCFDSGRAVLRLPSQAYEERAIHASPRVGAALERAAMEIISGRGLRNDADGALRSRAARVIAEALAAGEPCSAAVVARRLAVGQRTLQRRLHEEGTSFRALLDGRRAILARAYLRDGELPLPEIAGRLGFATSQAFHRAFRRWSGQTPAAFRARAGGAR